MNRARQKRILAVEDNPDTQLLLHFLLDDRYDIEVVPHVSDALQAAQEKTFDLLLLDINLGEELTGLDLLEELRQMEGYRETPALAVTAYAMPGDRERFLANGFNAYISKPFTRKDLYKTIEALLEAKEME